MASNPRFDAALEHMRDIHNRKLADYASSADPYANFRYVATVTGLTVTQVLQVLIATKMARLKELTDGKKVPNFESVRDTKLDLAVYSTILFSMEDEFKCPTTSAPSA